MIEKLKLDNLDQFSKNFKKIEEKINEIVDSNPEETVKTEHKRDNGEYFNQIIKAMEKTGFPLEMKIRNKLKSLGLDNSHYVFEDREEKDYNVKKMRELDVVSTVPVLGLQNYNDNYNGIQLDVSLMMIGSVKSLENSTICFYEQNIENYMLPLFPNFLFDRFEFIDFFRYVNSRLIGPVLDQYLSIFNLPFSFNLRIFDKKMNDKSDDNKLFDQASELARACEFFHDNSTNTFPSHVLIRGCFPVIFTDANIVKIKQSNIDKITENELEEVDHFIYLSVLKYPYKTPLVSKHKFIFPNYFPVLITKFKGIDESIELIKRIRDNIQVDIGNRERITHAMTEAHSDFRSFIDNYQREKRI